MSLFCLKTGDVINLDEVLTIQTEEIKKINGSKVFIVSINFKNKTTLNVKYDNHEDLSEDIMALVKEKQRVKYALSI